MARDSSSSGHETGDQRRPAGVLERARGAQHDDDGQDAAAAQPSPDGAQRQHRRGGALDHVADHDDEPAIAAVRHLADDQREHHGRHELREADQAEIERAAREEIELPAHRHGLDLQRQRGQHAGRPEKREGRVPEERRGRRIARSAQEENVDDDRGAHAHAGGGRHSRLHGAPRGARHPARRAHGAPRARRHRRLQDRRVPAGHARLQRAGAEPLQHVRDSRAPRRSATAPICRRSTRTESFSARSRRRGAI